MSADKWEPNRDEYAFLEWQLQEARKEITRLRVRLRRESRWSEEDRLRRGTNEQHDIWDDAGVDG